MNHKSIVSTPLAPQPIGPYSPGIKYNNMVFLSGQTAFDPHTGEIVGSTAAEQTEQTLKNLQALLDVCETGLPSVVKTTIFLKNMDEYQTVNEVYAQFFNFEPPARSVVEVSRLPKDVLVEIEAIAILPEKKMGGMQAPGV